MFEYKTNDEPIRTIVFVKPKIRIFCYYREQGLWWFRVFGYGIHYKNTELHPPLFSERTGQRKKLRLGKFAFGLLSRRSWL